MQNPCRERCFWLTSREQKQQAEAGYGVEYGALWKMMNWTLHSTALTTTHTMTQFLVSQALPFHPTEATSPTSPSGLRIWRELYDVRRLKFPRNHLPSPPEESLGAAAGKPQKLPPNLMTKRLNKVNYSPSLFWASLLYSICFLWVETPYGKCCSVVATHTLSLLVTK